MAGMSELPRNVQVLVSVALLAGIGVIILNEFMSSGNYSTAVNNTLNDGILGVQEVTGWLDIIGLAIAAGIVLSFVLGAIYIRGRNQSGGGY